MVMKIVIKLSLTVIAATAAFIAVCSFVSWGFDPASWTPEDRALSVGLWSALILWAYILVDGIYKAGGCDD